jgi:hypothetical protein
LCIKSVIKSLILHMYLLFLFGFCIIIGVPFGNEVWFNVDRFLKLKWIISNIFKVRIWNEELKRNLVKIEANFSSKKCSGFSLKTILIPILEKVNTWSNWSLNLLHVMCKFQPPNIQDFNENFSPNNRYICNFVWCLNSAPKTP